MTMFNKLKTKAAIAIAKKQMAKSGASNQQQQMILELMEKNPELFEKITTEIQAKIKSGKSQMVASMEVMKKYQKDLQSLAKK